MVILPRAKAGIEIQSGEARRHAQYGKCTTSKKKEEKRNGRRKIRKNKFVLRENKDRAQGE